MDDISPGQRLLPGFDSSPQLGCCLDALDQLASFFRDRPVSRWCDGRLPDELEAVMVAADHLTALLLAP